MAIKLRQSTASQEVPLGYFVDSTDGNTEETVLTIANTDIKIWKTGATTLANKNSGGATHISNGLYYTVLDATDTDTIGPMVIHVHVSGALTVRLECEVLDEAVYDWMFGTVAPLTPTVAGRTLDVSAGGEAGVDWANVGTPGSTVNLSATTVNLVNTLTTYTGNTPQTGDSYARIGANGVGLTSVALADATSDAVIADAVWNAATATYGSAGSYGLLIETDLDATISSRLASASYTAPTNLTAAQIATGVWQDTTAGDFTVASSIGKSLYTTGNAPGSASGLAIVGSNMGTVTSVSGAVGSVTSGVTVTTNNDKTNYSIADVTSDAVIADAVWNAATASYGSAGTYGLLIETDLDATISSRMASYTQPTGFLTATFPTTVASTTNITAGTITTATNVTNVNGLAAGVITTASINDGAITDAKFTVPTISGVATGMLGMMAQLWRRFFKKTVYDITNTNIKTYADDATTVLTTQTATASASTETTGAAT